MVQRVQDPADRPCQVNQIRAARGIGHRCRFVDGAALQRQPQRRLRTHSDDGSCKSRFL
jgi:hypothetical protein